MHTFLAFQLLVVIRALWDTIY